MCHRSLSADTSEVSLRTVRWGGTLLPAGSRAGDGMARFVSEEKAADASIHVSFIPNHKLRNHYNVNLKSLF